MPFLRRYLPLFTLAFGIAALYLYKLDGVGVLSTDEPRYVAIGRAMASTGDLVTPRLWGTPWFEKPPLVYWMTAAGTVAGLNPELSGRLPVAVLSLAFLMVSFWLLHKEFGLEAAAVSTALLATSAAWISESDLCLTDLPLAVLFSLAVWLALPLLRSEPDTARLGVRFIGMGIAIGLATLAKGLVPIALALPFFWFLRTFWRQWWKGVAGCIVIALPWYAAVTFRNGYAFIRDFFLKHHFERLYSPTLQHVQPWYYYFPILLVALFPWTPLVGLLAMRGTVFDNRRRFLAVIVLFGFLFFTASLNKLPGYLLPLVPSLFVLIGAQFEKRFVVEVSRFWLLPCALLIALIPLLSSILPESLGTGRVSGILNAKISGTEAFYVAVPVIVVFLARRSWMGVILCLCVVSGGMYLKTAALPILDDQVSARGMWRKNKNVWNAVCDGGTSRYWVYGLSFYRGSLIPPCDQGSFQLVMRSYGRQPPFLEQRK